MKSDLARLARVATTTGARITVYESPIHPTAIPDDPETDALSVLFLATCAALNLECYGSEVFAKYAPELGWHDATHAPPEILGSALKDMRARAQVRGITGQ